MMAWGTFDIKDDAGRITAIHCAPCTADGHLQAGHILSPACPCISVVERPGPGCPPIFIHEVIQ